MSSQLNARVEGFIEARRPGWPAAPGGVLGMTDRSATLGVVPVGLRDAFTGEPVIEDTRFMIGSISKSFAAIVAMQLVDEGLLDLHVPVTTYVPWFEVRSRFAPITTHHLLTHTAGLVMEVDNPDDAAPAVWSLRRTTAGFAPGERFFYSNDGYKLVGLIMESVSGRPIQELLRERILRPLGMTRTSPVITYEVRADMATPHQRLADERPAHRGMPLTVSPVTPTTTADGAIVSTASDMAAYARMLLYRGAFEGGRVLSEEAFAAFSFPHVTDTGDPGVAYGYGIDVAEVDGRLHLGHSGGMVGHNALLTCDLTSGVAAVMMVNGDAERQPCVRFALEAMRAEGAGLPLPEIPAAPDPLAFAGADELAGSYADAGDDEVTLRAVHGRVVLSGFGTDVVLEPAGETAEEWRFAVPHPDLDRFALGVERDDAGAVIALTHGPSRFVRAGALLGPDPDPPAGWEAAVGTYRGYNPWAPGFRVFVRAGRLWLAWPWFERPLTPLDRGEWRVGEEWHPDRVRFDAVVDGRAQYAIHDGAAFPRSFLD